MNSNDRKSLKRFETKIDNIHDVLKSHSNRLSTIEQYNKDTQSVINRLEKILLGNSDSGLVRKVERNDTKFKILGVAVTLFSLAVITIAGALIGGLI